ncbi:MAG: cupin domain-containing protein [Roseiarcus sp.]|uniref:cupin domain-containing protein n=1 Tax=Roseiarcus sp. TaxID=1969460 RepID=UPI003C47C092
MSKTSERPKVARRQIIRRTSNEKEQRMAISAPKLVGPRDGELVFLGGVDARFLIDGAEAGRRFALVEHPIPPRALAAPMHRHRREDEYSFVVEGSIGAMLGETAVSGNPGDLIFKPREQWHTFWNAGDAPARILEIISPAGFENYFRELAVVLRNVRLGEPPQIAELCKRYELDIDLESVPALIERFGVRFPAAH